MSNPRNVDELLRSSLVKIKELKARVSDLEGARREPIAIVGMGCRFPGGARTPEEYWRLLLEGADCVRPIPDDRWPRDPNGADAPGTRWAALLDRVDGFDAAFFGISPREAQTLDPQQRLLLEVAWTALEDAAIAPERLGARPVGVYVGISTGDYLDLASASSPASWDSYVATGNGTCFAAGRLSFALGLGGPSMSIDTACSSSLVATHLACDSLRRGESEVALAGGVNLILAPKTMRLLAATQALSADGRCKTFDAAANGFVRAEGAGLLVLKRLSDAQRDGDRIWAVIRGSAVNQDGRSTGLTTPNVLAQAALHRQALEAAGLRPEDVGLIEAHGTGTSLGDPIEVEALREVYAGHGASGTCALTSVKTNVGHLEAAAGVAGLIKAVLAVRHGEVPRHLHFRTLNPRISLEGTPFAIPARNMPWPGAGRERVAGVSSFGMSGTNAHVLVSQAPSGPTPEGRTARASQVFPLSGASHEALRAVAERMATRLGEATADEWPAIAHTARVGRAALDVRTALVATDLAEARQAVDKFLQGSLTSGARTRREPPRIAFLFTGQGSQYAGMGRALYETERVYRDVIDRVAALLDPRLGCSLVELLHADAAPGGPIDQTRFTQPCLMALEVALAALWRSWGVVPACLLGHSIGEISAAVVAEVLTLEQAVELVDARSRRIASLPAGGGMVSVAAPPEEIEALLARLDGRSSIAAINGPRSTVVAGEVEVVDRVHEHFRQRGVDARRMTVSHAFHSPLLDGILGSFEADLAGLVPRTPSIPMITNLTGRLADASFGTPAHWRRHVREPVRFAASVLEARRLGCDTFVEIGPGRALIGMARECLPDGAELTWLTSMRKGVDARPTHEALAQLWERGAPVEFVAYDRETPAARASLPTYPFQRHRHWVEVAELESYRSARPLEGHPLIGRRLPLAGREAVWEAVWSARLLPFLDEHRVFDEILVPGVTYLEAARAVGAELLEGNPVVRDLEIHAPMIFAPSDRRLVQLVVTTDEDGARLQIFSTLDRPGTPTWRLDASAVLGRADVGDDVRRPAPLQAVEDLDAAAVYAEFERRGLGYGTSFKGIVVAHRAGDGCDVEIVVPPEVRAAASSYAAHPAVLDAVLQAAALPFVDLPAGQMLLPVGFDRFELTGVLDDRLRVSARVREHGDAIAIVDVTILDATGAHVLGRLEGARLRQAGEESVRRLLDRVHTDWVFGVKWEGRGATTIGAIEPGPWVVLDVPGGPLGAALAQRLRAHGGRVEPLEAAGAGATIIDLRALGVTEGAFDVATAALVGPALELVQHVAERRNARAVHVVTRRAQAVRRDEPMEPAQATLSGLLRVARIEHPEIAWHQLDVGEGAPDLEVLVRNLLAAGGEDVLAQRGGDSYRARVSRRGVAPASARPPELRGGDAAYVVTGGLGALGARVVGWLVERGAGQIVVVGRRGPEAAAAVCALGTAVSYVTADVGTEDGVRQVLAHVAGRGGVLRGVFHAAGVLDDGLLRGQTPARFANVLHAKAHAAVLLDELTRDHPIEIFVLFSSVAALFGSVGQGAYAAANAVLDALAARRRAIGLPAISLGWGMWEGDGMAGRLDPAVIQRLRAQGTAGIVPEQGLAVLEWCLGRDASYLAVVPLEWPTFLRSSEAGATRLFDDLRPLARGRAGGAAIPESVARVLAAEADARPALVRELVRAEVAAVLGLASPAAVDVEQPLMDLGVDSLMAMELRDRTAKLFGASLSASLIYDHPTTAAIAVHVLGKLAPARAVSPVVQAVPSSALDEPIAVIGLGCRFPGGASDPAALWELLIGGGDVIREVPASRWDVDAFYDPDPERDGKMYSRWGGFLDGVELFDADFFGIAPREALAMDPQQRLLLEVAFEAFEDAGVPRDRLAGSRTGVFVGIMNTDYRDRMPSVPARVQAEIGSYVATGNAISVAAGRISYVFGLRGPTLAIDTACSSSLVSVHLACQALRTGEADLALAAGVNLQLSPDTTVYSCRLRALSPVGRCKTFDASADGYVRGDGCGVVVLKRLSQALADGDRIHAVIRGEAVNHDGRSSGLTAPNGPSQQEVIRRALARAGVAASEVAYVEAHGTGTALGDVVEAQALGAALGPGRSRDRPLTVSTIKTNLGHTEGAAGVAGLLKAILVLRHEFVPPHLHLKTPNPMIPWDDLPIRVVPREGLTLPGTGARVVGVSSFGISGTNAHLVVGSAPPPKLQELDAPSSVLVPISAHTPEAFAAQARAIVDHLRTHATARPLDVAFTLATRSTHVLRGIAIVDDRDGLGSLDAIAPAREADAARPLHGFPSAVPAPAAQLRRLVAEIGGASELLEGLLRELDDDAGPLRRAFADPADPGDADAGLALLASVMLGQVLTSWGLDAEVAGVGMGALAAAVVAGALPLGPALAFARWAAGPGTEPAPTLPALREAPRLAASTRARLADVVDGDRGARRELVEGAPAWLPSTDGRAVVALGGPVLGVAPARILGGDAPRRGLLVAAGEAYVAGGRLAWPKILAGGVRVDLPTYPFQRRRFWLEAAGVPSAEATTPVTRTVARLEGEGSATLRAIQAAPEARRLPLLVDLLAREVALALGRGDQGTVDPRQGFFDLGLDSLMAVELRKRIKDELGLDVPASVAFDHPNAEALARHLATLVGLGGPARPAPVARRATVAHEPIAIVGVGCRAPGGANSPAELWQMLAEGRDGLGDVPSDRWDVDAFYDPDPDAPGKMITRRGGFLRGVEVDQFDARFFGISPREAVSLDPQQRLLLEVTWEALEDAGIPADRLVGSRTGTFVGITYMDYAARALMYRDLDAMDVYAGTGNSFSLAAGRISYAFGFQGPTMAIDATCASSLVAIHLGCQALRSGEADVAVAGGVCLMLEPQPTVYLSKMRALSPDGICRTFDRGANGYARGEGSGVVVLKRLSDALADGDRIHAVVRGSAVNHGGRASGLTVPNGSAQETVIRAALADADVEASSVSYVEAHGTGTSLGDPIEARALGAVFGPAPGSFIVGSVKTNLGHLEAAAGVVGVIKTALALEHESIPPHVHFDELSPAISWGELAVEIPRTPRPWPRGGAPRRAGVSSFGLSGTNAHIVLEEAPARAPASDLDARAHQVLVISARGEPALRALAARWIDHLGAATAPLAETCAAAAQRRALLDDRLAISGGSREELAGGLRAYLAGEASPAVVRGSAGLAPGQLWVFSGHGSQSRAMGRELLDEPVFARTIRAVEAALGEVGWSLEAVLRGDVEGDLHDRIDVAQPAIFAVQVGLAALLGSWGVRPSGVVGHSLGEIAAAHVAGALSLEDATAIVRHRSRLMVSVRGQGAMVLLGLGPEEAARWAEASSPELEVAVVNGARTTALSGPPAAVEAAIARARAENLFARAVRTDVAFHGRQMDPLVAPLVEALGSIRPRPTDVPFFSSVEGGAVEGVGLDAAYWGRNLRQKVRFAEALARAAAQDGELALELAPHPILGPSIEEGLAAADGARAGRRPRPSLVLAASSRDAGALGPRRALGALWTRGVHVDWVAAQGRAPHAIELPRYAWQRQRYWIEALSRDPSTAKVAQVALAAGTEWRYEISWTEAARAADAPKVRRPTTALVVGQGPFGAAIADRLAALGVATRRLGGHGASSRPIDLEDPRAFDAELDPEAPPGLIVYAVGAELDAPNGDVHGAEGAARHALAGLLHLGQALVRRGLRSARLVVVTRGAEAVQAGEAPVAAGATLWGAGRSLALEQPDLWGGLIDADPGVGGDAAGVDDVVRELCEPDGEDQLALRSARRLVPRLVRATRPPGLPLAARDEAVLITGGLGGLGIELARWFVERGWRTILLSSRRGLPPRDAWATVPRDGAAGRAIDAITALEALGAHVEAIAADVTDEAAMRRALVGRAGPPLGIVVHAAGAFDFRMLADTTADGLFDLVRPKLVGGWVLERVLADLAPRAVVSFSSIAGVCGSAGMIAYGAANHALDAQAARWRAHGIAATAVSWGRWEGEGMGRGDDQALGYLERIGMRGMAPARALAELGALAGSETAHAVVADVDWTRYKPVLEARRRIPFLARLDEGELGGADAPLRARLAGTPVARRPELLREELGTLVAEVLAVPAGSIDPTQGFFELGMDSIMSVELRQRLQRGLGLALPSTLAFEHPSIDALALHLGALLELDGASAAPLALPPVVLAPAVLAPVADESLGAMTDDDLAALLDAELERPRGSS